MYLIIFEDGDVVKKETVTDDDKMAADDGYVDLINTDTHQRYDAGEWHDIKKV